MNCCRLAWTLIASGLLILIGRKWLPFDRLPGDFLYHRGNMTVYLPIGTGILLSIVLSLILAMLSRR